MSDPTLRKRQHDLHDAGQDLQANQAKRACLEVTKPENAVLQDTELSDLEMDVSHTLEHVGPVSAFTRSPLSPRTESQTPRNPGDEDSVMANSEANEYCCFGEIDIEFSSLVHFERAKTHVPVELGLLLGRIKVHMVGSGKYVGFLNSEAITGLMQNPDVRLTTTMSCADSKKSKIATDSQTTKTLHAILYGPRKDADDIGDYLDTLGVYLQHPTEYDPLFEYINPQYLVQPGSSIPKPEAMPFHGLHGNSYSSRLLEEGTKSEIHQIFDSASGPAMFPAVKQSPRLKTTLKEHQRKAFLMMAEKENGRLDTVTSRSLWENYAIPGKVGNNTQDLVRGGVLADDMGLGKTLSTLALIAWFLDMVEANDVSFQEERTTLIVAPKSTIPGWEDQVSRHVHANHLRIGRYHGPLRHQMADSLRSYDIVITTYNTLQADWKGKSQTSPLFSRQWARVVLDEAHHIRDRTTQSFKAALTIQASRRWCLTGTPIQNRLDDYGSLLSFIGMQPFACKTAFDYWIAKPISRNLPQGLVALRQLVAATCLRRTKATLRQELQLPPRTLRQCNVQLDPKDRELYEFSRKNAAHLVASMSTTHNGNESPRTGNILPIINTLRLICDHGQSSMPESAILAWNGRYSTEKDLPWGKPDKSGVCVSCGKELLSEDVQSEFACPHLVCSNCTESDEHGEQQLDDIVCPQCMMSNAATDSNRPPSEDLRQPYEPSAKVRELIKNLLAEQQENSVSCGDRPAKSVVFTYWTKMLDLLELALYQSGFGFERIDGKKSLEQRALALNTFSTDIGCTVMIATIGSVGEGVDLTAANFVHLLEPHWNPMTEEQALDRVHRMGQTRDVTATRYITNDSIENYVQDVKDGKVRLINSSLSHLIVAEENSRTVSSYLSGSLQRTLTTDYDEPSA